MKTGLVRKAQVEILGYQIKALTLAIRRIRKEIKNETKQIKGR